MLRFPNFLDSWLKDDGEVVSLTLWPPFTPHEDSWCLFLLEAKSTLGAHSEAGRIMSVERSSDLIGN
jgi:hypothetical protein